MPLIKNQDIHIFYEVVGQGQPLVMLHGFAGNSKDWKRNGYVEKLSDDYQLILIDERGHGLSDKPHDPAAYKIEKRTSDIVAVMEYLGLKRSHIWGYSMGGEVCFGLAQFYADCIESLIIGGMAPFPPAHPEVYDEQLAVLKRGITTAADTWGYDSSERREEFLRNDPKALIASTIAARDWSGCEDILETLEIPCLIYVGEADSFMFDVAKRGAGQIPEAKFVIIPGLDHGQAYADSHLILPHVKDFLQKRNCSQAASEGNLPKNHGHDTPHNQDRGR